MYEQIQALQEQGNTEAAAKLATDSYANAINQRSDELRQHLGALQSFMHEFKNDLQTVEDAILSIGRSGTSAEIDTQLQKITSLTKTISDRENGRHTIVSFGFGKPTAQLKQELAQAKQQLLALEAKRRNEIAHAHQQSAPDQVQQKGIEADTFLTGIANSLDKTTAKTNALIKLNKQLRAAYAANPNDPNLHGIQAPANGPITGSYYQKLVAETNKKYTDHGAEKAQRKALAQAKAAATAQQRLANIISSLGSNALGPVSAAWDKYAKSVRQAAQAGGKAIANGADVAQVQAQVAQAVDLANQAKNRAIAKVHNNLTAALASATGDQAKAQKIKIEQQYGQLLADLQRQGDTAGVALVKKLINVQEARAQLQKLQREVQQILSNRSRNCRAFSPNSRLDSSVDTRRGNALLRSIRKRANSWTLLCPSTKRSRPPLVTRALCRS